MMSMSARTRMRLLGESRFCRAHGVWEKGVRHRGGSIRASIEREVVVGGRLRSAPGARWAGSGLPLPSGAETPLPLMLAQQPALGAGGWCGRGVPWVWLARVRAREGLASRAWAWF